MIKDLSYSANRAQGETAEHLPYLRIYLSLNPPSARAQRDSTCLYAQRIATRLQLGIAYQRTEKDAARKLQIPQPSLFRVGELPKPN